MNKKEKEIDFQEIRRRINTNELSKLIMNHIKEKGFDHDINNDITRLEFLIACNTKIRD